MKTAGADTGQRELSAIAGEYLYDLSHEPPFVDANRRTGAACALYFLELNRIDAVIEDRVLEDVLGAVAAHRMNRTTVGEFFESVCTAARN